MRTSNLYFSTLRPPSFGVLGLLSPLDDAFALGTVFGAVPTGNERCAAPGAVAETVAVEDFHFQRVGGDDLHQNKAQERTAQGSGMELRTGDRLAIIQQQAVTIRVKMTAMISNQPLDRPPLL